MNNTALVCKTLITLRVGLLSHCFTGKYSGLRSHYNMINECDLHMHRLLLLFMLQRLCELL